MMGRLMETWRCSKDRDSWVSRVSAMQNELFARLGYTAIEGGFSTQLDKATTAEQQSFRAHSLRDIRSTYLSLSDSWMSRTTGSA
jgi:hypothetical protein